MFIFRGGAQRHDRSGPLCLVDAPRARARLTHLADRKPPRDGDILPDDGMPAFARAMTALSAALE